MSMLIYFVTKSKVLIDIYIYMIRSGDLIKVVGRIKTINTENHSPLKVFKITKISDIDALYHMTSCEYAHQMSISMDNNNVTSTTGLQLTYAI